MITRKVRKIDYVTKNQKRGKGGTGAVERK